MVELLVKLERYSIDLWKAYAVWGQRFLVPSTRVGIGMLGCLVRHTKIIEKVHVQLSQLSSQSC